MDIDKNFSCADPEVNRVNVTEHLWRIRSEGSHHESSITAIAAVQLLYVVVGLPWNFIIASTIVIKRLFRDPSYILLLSLVLSDLLVCGFTLPFSISSALHQAFTLGHSDYSRCQLCQAIVVVSVTLLFISHFSLALMASDRLFYIKFPFIYKDRMTASKATAAIIVVWIFCFLISIPPIFGFGEIKFANAVGFCSPILTGNNGVVSNVYYSVFLALVGTVPFVFIVIANIWLLVIACKSIGQVHDRIRRNNSAALHRRENERNIDIEYHKKQIHLAKVFGVILVVNTIVWIASSLLAILATIITYGDIPTPVLATAFLAFLSQPAIHPMLETCLVGKAKTAMVKILCIFCKKEVRQ